MRASDRAYLALLEEIQNGSIAPGFVIAEVEQAARLGVSRTPMREAIGRLIADGLIVQQSPRVLVVAGFDADNIRSLFEARRALEEAAARLAAERGDPERFAEIAEQFREARPESGEIAAEAYAELIARFDAALDEAVANTYLTSALRTVRRHLVRARRLSRENRSRLRESVAEHALIAAAISRGDAELAAHATHVHLHHALTSILSSIDAGEQPSAAHPAPAEPLLEGQQ